MVGIAARPALLNHIQELAMKKSIIRKRYYDKKIHSYGKSITFDKPGAYSIKIDPVEIKSDAVRKYFRGITLSGIRLVKE